MECLDLIRDIVQVDSRRLLLEEADALDSDLEEFLQLALFELENTVFLVWLVFLRHDDLLEAHRLVVSETEFGFHASVQWLPHGSILTQVYLFVEKSQLHR